MEFMGTGFTIAAAVLAFQGSVDHSPAPLKSTGPWNVEYAENMCLLGRNFGEGANLVTLGFKPAPLSEQVRVVLIRPSTDSRGVYGESRISFDDNEAIKIPYVDEFVKSRGIRVLIIDLKQADLAPLATARLLSIRAGNHDYRLAMSAVTEAWKAMEACEKDLLVSWGMDRAILEAIATRPKADLVRIFSVHDYPLAAVRNREQGVSGVRFWVGEDGKVRDCKVVESSGSAALDSRTCVVLTRRARFEPARTKEGRAVESISFARVKWAIPRS